MHSNLCWIYLLALSVVLQRDSCLFQEIVSNMNSCFCSHRVRTFPKESALLGREMVRALMYYALKVWSDITLSTSMRWRGMRQTFRLISPKRIIMTDTLSTGPVAQWPTHSFPENDSQRVTHTLMMMKPGPSDRQVRQNKIYEWEEIVRCVIHGALYLFLKLIHSFFFIH